MALFSHSHPLRSLSLSSLKCPLTHSHRLCCALNVPEMMPPLPWFVPTTMTTTPFKIFCSSYTTPPMNPTRMEWPRSSYPINVTQRSMTLLTMNTHRSILNTPIQAPVCLYTHLMNLMTSTRPSPKGMVTRFVPLLLPLCASLSALVHCHSIRRGSRLDHRSTGLCFIRKWSLFFFIS